MSNIVLRNLNSLNTKEGISEVDNADEVYGGFFSFSFANQNTQINTTIENILNINRDLPSLITINQVASLPPGGTTLPSTTASPSK